MFNERLMNMSAPVVLFVYNRLIHTKATLQALSENYGHEEIELYIFSDGPKSTMEDIQKVQNVRDYLSDFVREHCLRNVIIEMSPHNKGLATSVIHGVTEVFSNYNKLIVLEDDLVTNKDFYQYMNKALDYYENDKKIWSISGFSFPLKAFKRYHHDVFYSYRGCSWGWATWKNRWETIDWDVKDYNQFLQDKQWQSQFNRGGGDMTQMLTHQMIGEIDSWAIRWCFAQNKQEMYTVYPVKSKVENIGCDGSGTHSGKINSQFTKMCVTEQECKLEKLKLDKKITKEFYYKYTDTLWKKIVRNVKKYLKD